jgi:sulfatase modifying factor 1
MWNLRKWRSILAPIHLALIVLIGASGAGLAQSTVTNMVLIPGGMYTAPFQRGQQRLQFSVGAFCLDIFPVTNEDYLEFVRANPQWRRSQVERRCADASYLGHWMGDISLGTANPKAPVTQVSWFAARAYARWKGKRLPKLAEWELAAAGPTQPGGAGAPEFQKQILRWYCAPTPTQLAGIGSGLTSSCGVRDLHGLIWEWVADFDAAWAAESAGGGAESFCGGGAQTARDRTDYPTFMRFGFRASLRPDYCVHNLGFRCAASAPAPSP